MQPLEKQFYHSLLRIEGLEALGVKPIWNRQDCPYKERCILRDFKEKNQFKPCLFNPKMFRCLAYHYYEMPLLLAEKNYQKV